MYSLDLETLLKVLYSRGTTGVLRANLPQGFAGIRRLCVVKVEVNRGKVLACTIYNSQNGQVLLEGNEAYQKVRNNTLQWELIEGQPKNLFSPPSQSGAPAKIMQQQAMPAPSIAPPISQRDSSGSLYRQTDPRLQPMGYQQPNNGTYPSYPQVSTDRLYGTAMDTLIPKRTRQLSAAHMQQWPRNARSVYTLVNGINTISQIAQLLSLSVEQTYELLNQLQVMQFLVIER